MVISHLPPEQAAGVLEQMPAEISTEALRRMAWLDELSPDVLRDVERETQEPLCSQRCAGRKRGWPAWPACKRSLPRSQGPGGVNCSSRLAEQDQRLVRQLGYGATARGEPRFNIGWSHRRCLETTESTPTQSRGRATQEMETATEEFEELFSLEDRDLRRVFAAAELPMLVLALTGADEKFTRRILRQLPPREAEILRQRLTYPGPLRLRDIEAAQQEIV